MWLFKYFWRKERSWEDILEKMVHEISILTRRKKENDTTLVKRKRILLFGFLIYYIFALITLIYIFVNTTSLYKNASYLALSVPFLFYIIPKSYLLNRNLLEKYNSWKNNRLEKKIESVKTAKENLLCEIKTKYSFNRVYSIIENYDESSNLKPCKTEPKLPESEFESFSKNEIYELSLKQLSNNNEPQTYELEDDITSYLPPTESSLETPATNQKPHIFHPGYYPTISLKQGNIFYKIMGYLLDDYAGKPGSSYALICAYCSTHNGLIPVGVPNVRFKCFNCAKTNEM